VTSLPSVRLGPVSKRSDPRGVVLEAALEVMGAAVQLRFQTPSGPVSDGPEALLPAAFLSALRRGSPLRVETPVSARMLASLPRIQGVLGDWDERLGPVCVESAARPTATPAGARGVGCFFSGGIDSSYTLLTRGSEIDTLIYVHGFDVARRFGALRNRLVCEARELAAALGKTLVEVETNLREQTSRLCPWWLLHGAVLAGVAHFLSPRLQRVWVPSTTFGSPLMPWGSHPDIDPLWSSEALEIAHDSPIGRVEKTRVVAVSDWGLRHLHVCNAAWDLETLNCGRCEKCLRTQVALRALNALGRCSRFECPLDLRLVARVEIKDPHQFLLWEENLGLARTVSDRELTRAIERALAGQPLLSRALEHARRIWRGVAWS